MSIMSRRTILAVGLLAVWAGALGWHVKREYFPARSTLLTRAAGGIPPGPAYYSLAWDDRRLGWARVELDTLPGGGFDLSTLLEMEAAPLGVSGDLRAETTARLGSDLGLERFTARAAGSLLSGLSGAGGLSPGSPSGEAAAGDPAPGDTLTASGTVRGDSTLVAAVRRAGRTDTVRISTRGGLVPMGALPLRLAAAPEIRPGRRVAVRVLDPRSASVRTVEVEVREVAERIYPDSATRDTATGEWIVAGTDTVRAWRLTPAEGGLPVTAWVDEDGRLLEARLGSAFRLERTAFELAFFSDDSASAGGARRGIRPRRPREPEEPDAPDAPDARDGGTP